MENSVAQRAAAEAVGAFVFVFVGIGSIIVHQWTGEGSTLLVSAVAHGLVLAAMMSAVGHISGGHINPAVSIACAVTGRLPLSTAVVYVLAQLLGAVGAGLLLTNMFPADVWQAARLGAPLIHSDFTVGQAVLLEAVLTFALVLAFFGTAVDERGPKHTAGFAVGAVFTVGMLLGGPLTGAAMNPARVFASAVVGGVWDNHYVYWVGPVIGAVIAAMVYEQVSYRRRRRRQYDYEESTSGAEAHDG